MTRSLPDLQQAIHQLEIEKSKLALPPLHEIESQIQYHSARTHSADPQEAKRHTVELQLLLIAKQQAEQSWSRNGQINTELSQLRQQLHWAEQEQRNVRAEAATRDLQQAVEEFISAAKQTVRAYRRAQRQALANHAVPGATTGFPQDLSLSFLSGSPYSGFTIQQEANFGPLPFELRENRGVK
jgi:hypothetical protein